LTAAIDGSSSDHQPVPQLQVRPSRGELGDVGAGRERAHVAGDHDGAK